MMENGTSTAYTNGTAAATNGTATTAASKQQQLANAVSMESLDSAISTSNGGSSDPQAQVRTLFVSGLPADVKSRELYLLFRSFPGYEASQLKLTPSSKNGTAKMSTPVGFVTFATRQDADEARKKLQGVRFDPEQPQTIRLELARSNTKVTKPSKQPSPPNHLSATSAALPAILPPPAPILSHNLAVAQLAALQQQQLAAAVLLNQHQHHDNGPSATATNGVLAQQQLLAAVLDQQRHHQLLQNGAGADVQQHLAALAAAQGGGPAALAALSHVQQAQAVQQLLHQQQGGANLLGNHSLNTGAAALHGSNPQLAAVSALAAAQQHHHHASNGGHHPPGGSHWPIGTGNGQQQQQQQPCSTIFVGNLGPAAASSPQVVEEELKSMFSMFPGFSRIRMHAKSGAPVAFVEFAEVGQAMTAMQSMQGYIITANGCNSSGIRIEFAKTRMGETSAGGAQKVDRDGK